MIRETERDIGFFEAVKFSEYYMRRKDAEGRQEPADKYFQSQKGTMESLKREI